MKNKIIAKFRNFWKDGRNLSRKLSSVKRKKLLFSFFLLFVVGGVLFSVVSVKAGVFSYLAGGIAGQILALMTDLVLYLARFCINTALFFWTYFIELAAYNDFMNAPPVTIGWVVIRDFANMFFIVALMAIAIGTLLGIEQYEWKKSLVKLIFAAIFINFSKLILQLVLDFAQVLMDTFLIAFKGSSGNNLIKMFSFDKMTELLGSFQTNAGTGMEGTRFELFIGAVVALIMALMVMFVIGSYVVVMIGRMIVLWMLMIISPLAFVLSAFPFGKQYASEFWKNFLNYAMVAPVMVFFTWLAFASLQVGNIASDININMSKLNKLDTAINLSTETSISINKASTWENLASYFIAIGFFVVGITMVGRMGVAGGSMVTKAMDFTKKVATIASGYAAGRWLTGKGMEMGKGFAGDYGKIAWGQTGGRIRHMRGIRNIPLIGAAGGARRKAALATLQKREETAMETYKKEGGGIPGILVGKGTKRKLAEEEQELEAITKGKEGQIKTWKSDYTTARGRSEMPGLIKQRLAERNAAKNTNLATNEKTKDLHAQLQVALQKGEFDTVKERMNDMDKKLGISSEQARELDRTAAKKSGSTLVSSILEESYAQEAAEDAKTVQDRLLGDFQLGYVIKERNELEEQTKNTKAQLTKEKLEEILVQRINEGKDEGKKYENMSKEQQKAEMDAERVKYEGEQFALAFGDSMMKAFDGELDAKVKAAARAKAEAALGDKLYGLGDAPKNALIDAEMQNPKYEQEVRAEFINKQMEKEMLAKDPNIFNEKTEEDKNTMIKYKFNKLSPDQQKAVFAEGADLKNKYDHAVGADTHTEAEKNAFIEKTKRNIVETELIKEAGGEDEWGVLSEDERNTKIKTRIKQKGAGLDEEARTKIISSEAAASVSEQEMAMRLKQTGVYDRLRKLGGAYHQVQGQRGVKKTESEMERMTARVTDNGRMEMGKRAEKERDWEFRKARQENEDYEGYTYTEKETEIKKLYKTIGGLNGKKAKGIKLEDHEKEALKNSTNDMVRVLNSFHRESPAAVASLLGSLDSTIGDEVKLTSPDQVQNVMMSFLSGSSYKEVSGNFSSIQAKVRKNMKEKADQLYRAMMMGFGDAEKKGHGEQSHQQISYGVNEAGQKQLAFTNSLGAGIGVGNNLGTGRINETGSEWRKQQVKEMVRPGVSWASATDGRALTALNKKGRGLEFASPEAREAFVSSATLSATALDRDGLMKVNTAHGAGLGDRVIGADGKFDIEADMKEGNEALFQSYVNLYNTAKGNNAEQIIMNALKKRLGMLGLKKANSKELDEATIEDMVKYLNEESGIITNDSLKIKPKSKPSASDRGKDDDDSGDEGGGGGNMPKQGGSGTQETGPKQPSVVPGGTPLSVLRSKKIQNEANKLATELSFISRSIEGAMDTLSDKIKSVEANLSGQGMTTVDVKVMKEITDNIDLNIGQKIREVNGIGSTEEKAAIKKKFDSLKKGEEKDELMEVLNAPTIDLNDEAYRKLGRLMRRTLDQEGEE